MAMICRTLSLTLGLLLVHPCFAADEPQAHAKFIKTNDGKLLDIVGSVTISAPPQTVWAVMTDCPTVHEFVPNLKKCEILAENKNERWDIRRHTGKNSFPFKGAISEFKSTYTFPIEITFTRTGGDYDTLEGSWKLEAVSENATKLTYHSALSASVPVPDGLIKKGARKRIQKTLTALKVRVEGP